MIVICSALRLCWINVLVISIAIVNELDSFL